MAAQGRRSTQGERASVQYAEWRAEGWPRRLSPLDAGSLLDEIGEHDHSIIPASGINLSTLARIVTA